MKTIITNEQHTFDTLAQLKSGDFFVRDANCDRPMDGRVVYMVCHYHTRLNVFRKVRGGIVVVSLKCGRIDCLKPDQPIRKIAEPVTMRVEE